MNRGLERGTEAPRQLALLTLGPAVIVGDRRKRPTESQDAD
jgi:hypothetical protein